MEEQEQVGHVDEEGALMQEVNKEGGSRELGVTDGGHGFHPVSLSDFPNQAKPCGHLGQMQRTRECNMICQCSGACFL